MTMFTPQGSVSGSADARRLDARLRRFRPALTLDHQRELHAVAARIGEADGPEAVRSLLDRLVRGAGEQRASLLSMGLRRGDLGPTTQYLATLQILRDLLSQGWGLRSDDEGLLLDSPEGLFSGTRGSDPEKQKEGLRSSFAFARERQLLEPATSRFVSSVERRGIGLLFADGKDLADRLEQSARGGPAAVVPELEVIEPGARDPATGLLLQEIWRYARHHWSIPYQSTPGRNIFYLVRDAAVPARPLVGIAALGNPVLGSAPRDEFFGWSVRSFHQYAESVPPEERARIAAHLWASVARGIGEIYSEDILPGGWREGWRSAVDELRQIEKKSSRERAEGLPEDDGIGLEQKKIREAHTAVGRGEGKSVNWREIARTALYRRKRAGTLADLVWAHGVFAERGLSEGGGDLGEVLRDAEGTRAVEIVLRRIKQGAIASNVMELITCGAVPPYREVLGGKIVAMLMLGREVAGDFERRYSGRISLIASALAGRPITRPAKLAAISTSSLYALGSSQYNRISVKTERGALRYERIGKTESFGTVHFSSGTVETLGELARAGNSNRRTVNNLFGEGASPKLRLIRSGLEVLGLDPDAFLRHHSPRLLYAACTCANPREVMLGLEDPRYLLPAGERSAQVLVEHWRERWLAKRIARPEILARVREQNFETSRLGREISTLDKTGLEFDRLATEPPAQDGREQGWEDQTFVERLYRSTNSYADRLNAQELEAINVDLGVEGYLLSEVEQDRQVVVTGNPGDGKTHLIERLRAQLENRGTVVITDANALSDEEILSAWRSCRQERKPLVLAINEWPLYVLQKSARHADEIEAVEEALRQVSAARFYTEGQRPHPPKAGVVVIDLSLRDLLTPSVVERVVERLTQDRFYEGLNPKDPMVANRKALRTPRMLGRLKDLLGFVAPQAGHVTMRQLVGFVAFLLAGGQSAEERLKLGQDGTTFAYYTLAFEGGEGPLFEAVRTVFDPANVTNPASDYSLWSGSTRAEDWLGGQAPVGPLALQETERESAYRSIKRRFFFEHREGGVLLRMVPEDEEQFRRLLRSEEGAGRVRDLVLALNRFYEPDASDQERDYLQLWQAHRYDVRAPTTFVTLNRVSHQDLRLERLKLADWVGGWLPEAQKAQWAFALVASPKGEDAALLEIDRDLYLTLYEARRGLARASWSRTATRRVTRFADKIHRAVEKTSTEDAIRVRNTENDLDDHFEIRRQPARYRI